jgi:hypothetical protein
MEINDAKKMMTGKAAIAKLLPPISGEASGPKMNCVPWAE